MFQFLIGRVLWAVVLFLVMTFVTYVLFFLIPSNPVQIGRAQFSEGVDIRDAYSLDGPFYEEWAGYVWGIVSRGDLGHSLVNRRPVSERIQTAAPVTFSLIIGGAVVWMLIAIPLGVLSGLRPRSLLDRAGMVFVLIGISAHPVWLGLILRYAFTLHLGWFPAGGYCNLINPPAGSCGGPTPWFMHLVLPWFTFSLLFAALYVRMIRASVMETVNEDYVRTAYAKGAPQNLVIRRHILRNAMMPIIAMLSLDMAVAIAGPVGGAVFVERVFGLPGLGSLAIESLGRRDMPMILGVTIVVMVLVLVLNVIADIAYALVDPRIRVAAKPSEQAEQRVGRAEPVPATESA